MSATSLLLQKKLLMKNLKYFRHMEILHVCSIDWHKTHGLCLTGEAVISNTRVTCDHHTRLFSNLAHCSSVSVLFEHRYSFYAYHFNIFVSYNISNMCIV